VEVIVSVVVYILAKRDRGNIGTIIFGILLLGKYLRGLSDIKRKR